LGGRGRQISEFEGSLVYKVSSRIARAIQRNPVSKTKKKKKKKKKKTKKKSRLRNCQATFLAPRNVCTNTPVSLQIGINDTGLEEVTRTFSPFT
jgi:hypothetical protein